MNEPTANADSLLEAFRLADSFLPVGTFSVSYGLEQFIQDGAVTDGDTLRALVESYLDRLLGPGDLVALRSAYRSAIAGDIDGVCTADRRFHATMLAAELRASACQSGKRLLDLQCELSVAPVLETYVDRVPDRAPGTHAVVFGVCTACREVPIETSALAYCHAFVTGLLGAAQRLGSFGHTETQRVLVALQPAITGAVENSAERSLDRLMTYAPLVDIASMHHERAERRLFTS